MNSRYLFLMSGALVFMVSSVKSMEGDKPLHGYRPLDLDGIKHDVGKLLKKTVVRQDSISKMENHDVITELPLLKVWSPTEICNQGNQGSCTANSIHAVIKYLSQANSKTPTDMKNNPDILRISRSYQYYNTRFYEGNLLHYPKMVKEDTGASIAGSLIALDKYGSCPESIDMTEENIIVPDLGGTFKYTGFPYNDKVWDLSPDPESYRLAFERSWDGLNTGSEFTKSESKENPYARVSTVIQYQDLASKYRNTTGLNTGSEQLNFTDSVIRSLRNNHPVAAGIMLDNTFMRDQHGYIPTPDIKHFKATGGHAISIVGYGPYNEQNKQGRYFKFINSWGSSWGDKGFGYLEDKYFSNVAKFQIEAYDTWFNMNTLHK